MLNIRLSATQEEYVERKKEACSDIISFYFTLSSAKPTASFGYVSIATSKLRLHLYLVELTVLVCVVTMGASQSAP